MIQLLDQSGRDRQQQIGIYGLASHIYNSHYAAYMRYGQPSSECCVVGFVLSFDSQVAEIQAEVQAGHRQVAGHVADAKVRDPAELQVAQLAEINCFTLSGFNNSITEQEKTENCDRGKKKHWGSYNFLLGTFDGKILEWLPNNWHVFRTIPPLHLCRELRWCRSLEDDSIARTSCKPCFPNCCRNRTWSYTRDDAKYTIS